MSDNHALRLSLHTGGLFRHDAVSASLLAKLRAIEEKRRFGVRVDARALVSYSEFSHPSVVVAPGACGTLDHPWFWSADVCIYEFAIWYEAFDTVFVVPEGVAAVAVYHNVTPPGLAPDPQSRRLLERSCGKKANLHQFDHVMCDSPFSRDELLELGIDCDRLSVVPLPPSISVPPDLGKRRAAGTPVELLYVGRFVYSKGVIDLLHAARAASALCSYPFRLCLAGNERLSDPEVIAEIRRLAMTPELSSLVRMAGEIEDDELAALYVGADALVLPSYHEGYCIPVVEAIAAGALVITSDAGNLPNIVGGVGRTVPVGDVDALAGAIADLVSRVGRAREGQALEVMTDDGPIDAATWQVRVDIHRGEHSLPTFRASFWAAVATALAHAGRRPPDWMAEGASCA